MTLVRLVYDIDATACASGPCGAIYIRDKDTWAEIALEKKTAIMLRDSLTAELDNWGLNE